MIAMNRTMLSTVCCAVAALFAVGITTPTYAAGFAVPGVGIKARSMGGSFRGLADDWSAARYNPAGLAFMESNQLNLTLGLYSPRLTYNPDVSGSGADLGFHWANGKDNFPVDDLWPTPSMGGVYLPEQTEGLALGAAVFWPHDVNFGWDIYAQPSAYDTDYEFPKQEYRTDMDVLDIHPVVARKFGENFSLGAGIALTNGDLVYNRILFVDNTMDAPYDVYPFHSFAADFRTDGNGFGVGANVGLFWRASDNVSVGLSVQSPVHIPMEGTATLDMAWPRDFPLDSLMILDGFQRTFYAGVDNPGRSAEEHSSSNYKFDLDLPAEVGAGVGIRAGERLTLAFDAALTFWSSVDEWTFEFTDGALNRQLDTLLVESVTVPFEWEDQIRVSGGFEYVLRENVAVLGGAYYDGSASNDRTSSISFPSLGSSVGVTGGVAYSVTGRWTFAAAQELAFYSEKHIAGGEGDPAVDVFPGQYSQTRYETLFSITYGF